MIEELIEKLWASETAKTWFWRAVVLIPTWIWIGECTRT